MKYLSAILSMVLTFMLSALAQTSMYKMTERYYAVEHASGTFSYVHFEIIMFTPFLGLLIGWKYWTTKRISFLYFFPIYFIVMH